MATESILPLTMDHSSITTAQSNCTNDINIDSILLSNDFQTTDSLLNDLLANDQEFINGLFDPSYNTDYCPLMSPSLVTPSLSTPFTLSRDERQNGSPVDVNGYAAVQNGSPVDVNGYAAVQNGSPFDINGYAVMQNGSPVNIDQYSPWSDQRSSPSTSASDFLSNSFHSNHIDPNTGLMVPPTNNDTCIDLKFEESETEERTLSSSERKTGSLILSDEERRLLSEEGIDLPTDVPLTKAEERHLKRIRRKIKNKQSAADSRKRKKEYIDGLEKRVEKCTSENFMYKKRVEALKNENKSLLSQLNKLQELVAKYSPSKIQTGSFLMIFVLSFSFLVIPQYLSVHSTDPLTSISGTGRTLLDVNNFDEFGNKIDPVTGQVLFNDGKGVSPVPPPPWKFQSPLVNSYL